MEGSRGNARTRAWGASGSNSFSCIIGFFEERRAAPSRLRNDYSATRSASDRRRGALRDEAAPADHLRHALDRARATPCLDAVSLAIAVASAAAPSHIPLAPNSDARAIDRVSLAIDV